MVVIDVTTFYVFGFLLVMALITINRQGGFKIVTWRIMGIRWFMRVEKQPDGTAKRSAHRWKGLVKEHSIPSYSLGEKTWFVGDEKSTVRVFGGPQWVYKYNDSRPILLEHEGDAIDPAVIHSAFENKSIEAFNGLNRKPDRFRWGMMGLAIIIIVILSALSAYYSYYFGINNACAVHAHGIACG
jgi:hypothetical protein